MVHTKFRFIPEDAIPHRLVVEREGGGKLWVADVHGRGSFITMGALANAVFAGAEMYHCVRTGQTVLASVGMRGKLYQGRGRCRGLQWRET